MIGKAGSTRHCAARRPGPYLRSPGRRAAPGRNGGPVGLRQESLAAALAVDWTVGTMHDLRKSYATLMARAVPMHEWQRLLGHASITTTAEYYTEAGDDVTEAVRLAFAS